MDKKNNYCVYKYESPSEGKVYIGLTKDLKRRDREHRNRIDRDRVYKNFDVIPKPIVLKENLTQEEAKYCECYFVELYKNNKEFNIINKAKPGGVGGNYTKWTKEKCKKEAMKYNYVGELEKQNQWVYRICLKNNWLDEFGLKRSECCKKKWTYETLKTEVLKYSSRKQFARSNVHAYSVCKKNGWLDELIPLQNCIKWTYDVCKLEAAKYSKRGDFRKKSYKCYDACLRHGWLDLFFKELDGGNRFKQKWTKEKCREEALKYKSRSEFINRNKNAYNACLRNRWLDEFYPKLKQLKPK